MRGIDYLSSVGPCRSLGYELGLEHALSTIFGHVLTEFDRMARGEAHKAAPLLRNRAFGG